MDKHSTCTNKSFNKKHKKNKNQKNHNTNNKNKSVALSKALSWILRHAAPKLNLPISTDGYIPVKAILKCPARNMVTYTVDDILHVVETNEKQRFKLCQKFVLWEEPKHGTRNSSNDNGDGNDNRNNKSTSQDFYTFVNENEDIDMNEDSEEKKKETGNRECSNANENENENDRKVRAAVPVLELCIRANQGHSIEGINCEELLTLIPPEELSNLNTIVHGTNKDAWVNHIQKEGLNKMKRNHIHFARGLPSTSSCLASSISASASTSADENGVISGMRRNSQIHIYVNGKACAEDGIKFYRSSNGVILTSGLENSNGTLPVQYFSSVIDAKTKKELLA